MSESLENLQQAYNRLVSIPPAARSPQQRSDLQNVAGELQKRKAINAIARASQPFG